MSAQLEIGEQLGLMDGMDSIHSFVFYEYAVINREIGPISTVKHDLFVADRNRIFSADIQSAQAEFIHQATPIHGLQQSRPKCCMDGNRCIDDMMANLFSIQNSI